MRRQSPVDDHPPAPLASTPPDPLRPPPGRSGEPRLAPATRRLQENGDPAQDSGDGSPLLGLANQDLDRVEAAPRDRDPRHRPPLATAPVPRTLDQALRPASAGPSAYQRRDRRPHQKDGSDPIPCGARQESTESSSSSGSMSPSVPSLAYSRSLADPRRRPGGRSSPTMSGTWSRWISSRCPRRACACSSSSSCSLTIAGASSTST